MRSLAPLLAAHYAHRGRCRPELVENTIAAFRASAKAGMGAELDVHLSRDGQVLVHHDQTLHRLAGRDTPVAELTADEASRVRLAGTDQHIPLLDEVLAAMGDLPVLVELKPQPTPPGALELAVARCVERHTGPVAVIGFDPDQLAAFADVAPQVPRGQSSGGRPSDAPLGERLWAAVNGHRVDATSRPHLRVASLADLRSGDVPRELPVIGWTAQDPQEVHGALADGLADAVICAGFTAQR